METCQCSDCGKHLSVNSIRRHKKNSCNGKGVKPSTTDSSNLSMRRPIVNNKANESKKSSNFSNNAADELFNKIINENDEKSNDNLPIQLWSGKEVSSPSKKSTKNGVLSIHEAAKKLNIIPAYDSEDESIIDDEYEDDADFENKDFVQGRGRENYNVSENADDYESKKQLKPLQLKARLYTSGNKMKVFELDLDVDRALSNIDLLEYVKLLKVLNFRNVFHIDELPKRVNDNECGIVNLSPHEQLGTHWVCYVNNNNTRIYFDSFGRKTPLEIQKYIKTAKEFRNDTPAIQRNTDIVQGVNTKICGHLCLFVLTSLMREHFSFSQVMDQLNYAFAEYYY